jgi:hypothetical protein
VSFVLEEEVPLKAATVEEVADWAGLMITQSFL